MTYRKISGAILAGGKAARFGGKNKAFIEAGPVIPPAFLRKQEGGTNGMPIIQRSIGLLKEIFDEIIIVTNSPGEYTLYKEDCLIVTDILKGKGPLGGIHAGLTYTSKEAIFFVACDMPNLHNDIIRRQIKHFEGMNCDALVPRVGTFLEPLHAVYKKSLKDKLGSFLRKGSDYSVRSFLETIKVSYWDLPADAFHRGIFRNINTLEDLKGAEK